MTRALDLVADGSPGALCKVLWPQSVSKIHMTRKMLSSKPQPRGALGDATMVTGPARTTVAPDLDTLVEPGEPLQCIAHEDEALPLAAIATGASLVRAGSRVASVDGMGALLRYVTAGGSPPAERSLRTQNHS
ncbi:hypothetical protein ACOJVU_07580 [Mycobacterium sp. THU-M104]|uniref:hypothetical protein n=1 Tax=Mycobacterium sp. THU-M104 TaxID=3410515 RepID=UPI003B991F39